MQGTLVQMRTGRIRAIQQTISAHPASGNRCEALNHLLQKGLSLKSIFEWKEYPQDAILKDEEQMKAINKTLENFKCGSLTETIRDDLTKGDMIFSEESSRVIYEMGKWSCSNWDKSL